jgi:hypothetical protein
MSGTGPRRSSGARVCVTRTALTSDAHAGTNGASRIASSISRSAFHSSRCASYGVLTETNLHVLGLDACSRAS